MGLTGILLGGSGIDWDLVESHGIYWHLLGLNGI